MGRVHLRAEDSALLVVDLQPKFMGRFHEPERVIARSRCLIRCARTLGLPVVATEQNPERMGGTEASIRQALGDSTILPKMAFSCMGAPGIDDALTGRHQIIVAGIETHICVSQTVHDLLQRGYQVAVAQDTLSSSTLDRHESGLERLRSSGAVLAHSEALVYEWMKTAEHPAFREILGIVKES